MATATGHRDYKRAAQLVVLLVLGAGLLGPARPQWPRAFQEAMDGLLDPPFDDTKAGALAAVWPTRRHAIPLPRLFVPSAPEAAPAPEAVAWHQAVASQLAPAPKDRPILTLADHEIWLGDTHVMGVPALPAVIEDDRYYPYSYTTGDRSLSFMLRDLGTRHPSYAGQMLRTRLTRSDSLLSTFEALHRASLEDIQAYLSGADRAPENLDLPRDGRLRVLVPGDTPYLTWLGLLDTAAGAGLGQYYLLTGGTALSPGPGAIRWGYGSWSHSHCVPVATMQIDLLVVPEGVALRTDEGPFGPGCVAGEGLTFPREPGSPTDLAECIRQLDDARPDVRHYHNAIWADPTLPVHRMYEALLLLQPLLRSRHDREDHSPDGMVSDSPDAVLSAYPLSAYPRLRVSPAATSVEEWQRSPVLATDEEARGSRHLRSPFSLEGWRRDLVASGRYVDLNRQLGHLDAAILGLHRGFATSPPMWVERHAPWPRGTKASPGNSATR